MYHILAMKSYSLDFDSVCGALNSRNGKATFSLLSTSRASIDSTHEVSLQYRIKKTSRFLIIILWSSKGHLLML